VDNDVLRACLGGVRDMNLSAHFTLAEMIASDKADELGIDNTPTQEITAALRNTCERMEAVRSLLGDKPIIVSSGFRNKIVNRHVGGSVTSDHMMGRAVDFVCPSFGEPIDVCRVIAASEIEFDQLIEEGSWVHIGFGPKMRREIKTKIPGGYRAGLGPTPTKDPLT
jgi:zinc D-Ala-D-Ala carboxypeptidase